MPVAITNKRSNVTVDDRRAVLVMATGRKIRDILQMDQETFIRRALKDRLNWPHRDPAPEAVKVAAKAMAAELKKQKDAAQIRAEIAEHARQVAIKAKV